MRRLSELWTLRGRAGLALAWGLGAAMLGSWVWLVQSTGRQPAGDGPHVLGTSMRLAQQLRQGDLGLFVRCQNMLIGPHPPGAYLPATGVYTLFGPGSWQHLLAGALLLGLCMDGTRRLGGGLASWIWLGAAPLVWLQAESYGVDLVAAACVVQALSHLHASEGLERRGHAAAWGAWMGACFVAKYTAPMFLWAPCVGAGALVLLRGQWRNLGWAVLSFCVVALPWWLLNFQGALGYLSASQSSSDALMTNQDLLSGPWWTAERLGWYPRALVDLWGWPGATLAALALLLPGWRLLRSPKRWDGGRESSWWVPALGIAGGLLLLSTQAQRQDRYLLPMLPLAAAALGSIRLRDPLHEGLLGPEGPGLGVALAAVGAVGLYGTAAVFGTWTEVPAERSYHHGDWQQVGEAWPWVHESFAPTSLSAEAWELDGRLTQLRQVQGSREGTVGFLLDESGGAPGYGLVLSRVAALDLRWHVATVMVLPSGEAAVFVGPFTRDDWPSRDFSSLLAILRPGDPNREVWLRRSGLVLVDSWSLPDGKEGRIYRTPDGAAWNFLTRPPAG